MPDYNVNGNVNVNGKNRRKRKINLNITTITITPTPQHSKINVYMLIRLAIIIIGSIILLSSCMASEGSVVYAQSYSYNGTIQKVFGQYAPQAVHVMECESGGNPTAHNSSGAAGLFQIMPATFSGTSQAGKNIYDPTVNIIAAHDIFVRNGNSFSEWTCQ